MNKPAKIVAAPPLPCPDYHSDGYGWAMAQAAIIRERRLDSIDWDNVAEEIETIGRSERNVYRSHLIQLLIHILKWDAQPERRGKSWYHSILNHREDALQALAENPSLKPELEDILAAALKKARRLAAQESGLQQSIFEGLDISSIEAFERPFERPEND
jgi:hypothetical protein